LGDWLIYRYVAETLLRDRYPLVTPLINYGVLDLSLVGYNGDVIQDTSKYLTSELLGRWTHLEASDSYEVAIKAKLPSHLHVSAAIGNQTEDEVHFTENKTKIYERSDGKGPTAVVVYDHSSDLFLDLLSQSFRRTVYIQKSDRASIDSIYMERPDFVIEIIAERYLSEDDGWPGFFF
jgi:hypothetical protein